MLTLGENAWIRDLLERECHELFLDCIDKSGEHSCILESLPHFLDKAAECSSFNELWTIQVGKFKWWQLVTRFSLRIYLFSNLVFMFYEARRPWNANELVFSWDYGCIGL